MNADLRSRNSQESKSVGSEERKNLQQNDEGQVVIGSKSTESHSPDPNEARDNGEDAKGEHFSTLEDSPSRSQRHDKLNKMIRNGRYRHSELRDSKSSRSLIKNIYHDDYMASALKKR